MNQKTIVKLALGGLVVWMLLRDSPRGSHAVAGGVSNFATNLAGGLESTWQGLTSGFGRFFGGQ